MNALLVQWRFVHYTFRTWKVGWIALQQQQHYKKLYFLFLSRHSILTYQTIAIKAILLTNKVKDYTSTGTESQTSIYHRHLGSVEKNKPPPPTFIPH